MSAIARASLNAQVYDVLSDALLEGRLPPRQRLKIRDLAATLGVSETPVREAMMQLVSERALELRANRSLSVPRLSAPQYLELRAIRLELEGLAGQRAAGRATPGTLSRLRGLHRRLLAAEAAGRRLDAVRLNWLFHSAIYELAAMPELLGIIRSLWLRTGPLLTLLYPHAPPTYPGRHRHLDMLDSLQARDGDGLREAIRNDTVEGGVGLLHLLVEMDAGRRDEAALCPERTALDALVVARGRPGPAPRRPPAVSSSVRTPSLA